MSASHHKDALIHYYSRWSGQRTYVNPRTVVRTLQQRRLPSHAHILDIGFGNGEIALAVAQAYPQGHIEGIDLTQHNVDMATERAVQRHLTNVHFRVEDAETWQPSPQTYHAVLAMQVMQFITQPDQLIQHVFQALKPGGTFLFATPFLPADTSLHPVFHTIYTAVIPNSFQYRTEQAWYDSLFAAGFHRIYTAKAHWDPNDQPPAWLQAYRQALARHQVPFSLARRHTWGGLISARKPTTPPQ